MSGMTFYGLFVDLSWEPKIEHGAPWMSALVASTPAAEKGERSQVAEVLVPLDKTDEIRSLLRRRVHIVAAFKGDKFYANPSDVRDYGEERLDRILPELEPLRGGEWGGLRLFTVRSDSVRAVGYEAAPGQVAHVAFESQELTGPIYADRVFAAYNLKPWLRREKPTFRTLFGAETCLVVARRVGGRLRITGVLPIWECPRNSTDIPQLVYRNHPRN